MIERITYTAAEMQSMLGVGEKTLRAMVRRSEIPCVRTGRGKTGRILFLKPAIDEWAKAGGPGRRS